MVSGAHGRFEAIAARGAQRWARLHAAGHPDRRSTARRVVDDQPAEKLLLAPPDTLMGLRDRAILGLLIGCGLRRDELATLTFEHLQQRDGRWVLVELIGKGGGCGRFPCLARPNR
jgi:site-specific recombinase XerC